MKLFIEIRLASANTGSSYTITKNASVIKNETRLGQSTNNSSIDFFREIEIELNEDDVCEGSIINSGSYPYRFYSYIFE